MALNRYEVVLLVDGKIVVRGEWAVNPMDAVMQGMFNVGPCKDVKVKHVGPPPEEIEKAVAGAAEDLGPRVLSALSSLLQKGKGPPG